MAFEQLKERQSVVWGSAPFENVALDIADVHEHLVAELGPKPGEEWLDVATGTGGIAVRAARAGANVTASDLAPALVDTAKRLAADEGLEIEYHVADAEELPYGDESFDVVSSCLGAIFAPDHAAVAHELARVCRPGGRLGLSAWDPEGALGSYFQAVAEFQPPLPDGAGSPLQWGREGYARDLLGSEFDLRFVRGSAPQRGSSAEEIWELFRTSFGPIKTLYEALPEPRNEKLHRAYVDHLEQYRTDRGIEAPREYLLILGMRR